MRVGRVGLCCSVWCHRLNGGQCRRQRSDGRCRAGEGAVSPPRLDTAASSATRPCQGARAVARGDGARAFLVGRDGADQAPSANGRRSLISPRDAGGLSYARVAARMCGGECAGALAGAVGNISDSSRLGVRVVLLGAALDLMSFVTLALGRRFEVGQLLDPSRKGSATALTV